MGIDPFEDRLVQPATYDLRLGPRILAAPLNSETLGQVVDLTRDNPSYAIQPGQMVGVQSKEKLRFPLDISGRFGIRSSLARIGINAFGGLQLDPGFTGVLIMNLLNVGPEPVPLELETPFFTVELQRLDEPARRGYSGPYQGQTDFPADQYNFIMSARTTSLAEIPVLRDEVARLSVLIEELEERLPDPDEGLELREEIENQLSGSREYPRESLLSIADIRDRLAE